MAGNYPNVPSWRMAYDRDGTQLFQVSNGNVTAMTNADALVLNDEGGGSGSNAAGGIDTVLIFPELRDVDGWFTSFTGYTSSDYTTHIETSVDTTNGLDGTWVVLVSSVGTPVNVVTPQYRSEIKASTALAVKAVKFRTNGAAYGAWIAIHVYGEIAPNQNPNRLSLWHPTLDQRITPAFFDWGNVPRSSSADKTFRVKNLSTVQTANSIRVAQEILTDTTPSVVGQHTLAKASAGSTFLAQVNVGALAPGAISEIVTLRRVTPSNAVLSLWCHRVFAEAGTWT